MWSGGAMVMGTLPVLGHPTDLDDSSARAYSPILRIGDQVLTFDVFWPEHLQEVRSTVYIHVQSI